MTSPLKDNISFSECFGRGIKLYADHFPLLVNFSFACTVPTILKTLLDSEEASGLTWTTLLFTPIIFIVYTFFAMCLSYAIAILATGQLITIKEIVAHVSVKFLRGVGGYSLLSLAVLAGIILLVLPGLYCLTVFYFFIFAILLEEKGVWESFKRSDELVRPHFWKVLAAHGLVFLLMILLLTPFMIGMSMMGWSQTVISVVIGVASALIMPILVAFYYYIYATLKAGHDGVINISVHS